MVYRGMDIGTAKPGPEILAEAPHRLIDIRDPAESYSAGEFRADALREMAEIHASARIPLLVGGTMLYFSVLQHGLAALPVADPALRAEIDRRAAEEGWPALHAELERLDPEAGARIHVNDAQRIQRALEVVYQTGVPITLWQNAQQTEAPGYRYIKIVLAPERRSELGQRIETRFETMMEQGFLSEVEALYRRPDLTPRTPALRAVGYRQLWEHLEGRSSLDLAIRRGIVATRQLAKRQMTWLRREEGAKWFDSLDGANRDPILNHVRVGLGDLPLVN